MINSHDAAWISLVLSWEEVIVAKHFGRNHVSEHILLVSSVLHNGRVRPIIAMIII